MARTAQTQLAVLGALSVEPMTGYAVRQAIAETLGHFWSESFGQIYPTLASLEAEGAIRRAEAGATSGSVFTITDAGLDRLQGLLAEPVASTPPRNGLLLRLFFGRHLGIAGCRDLLQGARDGAQAALARYEAIREGVLAEPQTPDTPFWLMTLSAGLHSHHAHLAWLDETLAQLDAMEEASGR